MFGIFAGCDLVGKDVAKYRNTTALKVGEQNITVGKLLDTFNSYYNNYYYYILYNGWTVDNILDLAIQSLISQYMRVDAYTSDTKHVQVEANKDKFHNAEYLEQYQLDYSVSYVKYLLFDSFDSTVLEKIEAKYKLGDEETEDTSRDFFKYDDLKGAKSYAKYYLDQNFTNDGMSEYIEKYFGNDTEKFANPDLSKIEEHYLATAESKVDELNKRIDKDDEKITLADYQKFQEAALKQYQTSVKNNYGMEFDKFVKLQVEDMITSSIINLYNYEIYKEIENDTELKEKLADNYNTLKNAQKTKFAVEKDYASYIENLSSGSFIYDIPEGHEDDYVFVKNILIPFSASQSAKLASLKADLGTDKDAKGYYVKYRNSLAAQIEAEDFNSEKDEDGKHDFIKNLFKLENGKVVINTAVEGKALNAYLKADGSVTGMEKDGETLSADDTIKELMMQFNTDVAQHSAMYSYVVRVNAPESYRHQWVQEFVDATEDALAAAKAKAEEGQDFDPNGYYGIRVSDYGVHIVYIVGYVKADAVNFVNTNYLDTSTTEYRLFKTYFEERQNKMLSEEIKALQKTYASKVESSSVFKKFLKENGMKYDLAETLKSYEG